MQSVKNGSKGHHTFYFNYSERIPADYIETNITYLDWSVDIDVKGYNFYSMNVNRILKVDNVEKYNVTDKPDCRTKYKTYTIASGSLPIYHNPDGTKTISVYFKWQDIDTASYMPGTCEFSETLTLTTIPRTTKIPNLSGNIESSYNIPLNPASSSFTHSLKVKFGNIEKWINASGNLQSGEYKFSNSNIPFTIPSDFYSKFTGKYGTGTLTLYTYSGSTQIGTSTSTLTANCNETKCRPVIEGTLKDINPVTLDLTGDANKVIKGFSKLEANLTTLKATNGTNDNSTITSQTINNVVFTGTKPSVENVSSNVVQIVVTNSRGFSTTKQLVTTGELIDYFSPLLTISPKRIEATSNNVKLTYSGKFFNQSFGSVSNTLLMNWYYKEDIYNSDWILGGSITPSLNNNDIVEATMDCGSIFEYRRNYRFKVSITDKLTTGLSDKEESVTAGIPAMDIGPNHVQVHVPLYDKDDNKFLAFRPIREIPDDELE